MFGTFGIARINFHKQRITLDENKQYSSNVKFDRLVSVTNNGKKVKHTINDCTLTVTDENYNIGDEVDVWLYCVRPSEMGGFSEMVLNQQDEDTIDECEGL